MSTPQPSTSPSATPVFPLLAALLVVDSLHFIWARALEPSLPPTSSAFFVLTIALIEVGVYAIVRGEVDLGVLRRHYRFFVAIGFLVSASTALTYTAVVYVDPGTASMLAQLTVVFALALGYFWLRERLNRLEWIGAAICIVGAILISFQASDVLRLGSLLVLIASFSYALHAAIVKRHGGGIDFMNFFLYRLLGVAIFLMVIVLTVGDLQPPPRSTWWILLAAGTIDVVISRVLYYLALRRMRLGLHAVVLTMSPVLTILFSWLLFQQLPTLQAVIGGSIVITGIVVLTVGRQGGLLKRRRAV